MPRVDLKSAVNSIYQTLSQRERRGQASPFFFVVGAGISYPAIPLADEVEAYCRREAEFFGHVAPSQSLSKMESYSYWLEKAFHERKALQEYLRDLMEKKAVTKANLRLAHLLVVGKLGRTVFTPNFDDLLSKAVELFGQRPLVCDHPQTVARMTVESEDIQIVHVHGSYWFYDLCNLSHEIQARSASLPMLGMLDQTLREHSPIVLGYSGWDGDIIMQALKRRMTANPLGTPIYWFCFRRSDADTLPEWLTKDEQVRIVLPEEPTVATSGGADKLADATSRPKEPLLAADRVLDSLIARFKLPAPPLTNDPLGFFADRLVALLGDFESGDGDSDIYNFPSVIRRVREASGVGDTGDELEGVRDALRRADYRDAIRAASLVNLQDLARVLREELMNSMMEASLALLDDSVDELAGYNMVIQLGDMLADENLLTPLQQGQVAKALSNKGLTLGQLGRIEEEVAVYDEILRRCLDSTDVVSQEGVVRALLNKGVTLGQLGRLEEEIAVYDELLRRFLDSSDAVSREGVARALHNKGVRLGQLERGEEEIAVYDELLRRFTDSPEPALQEQVARALVNKGVRLGQLGRGEEEIVVYDELLRRFTDSLEPALQEQVARALINKGIRFGLLGRSEESGVAYDELLRRFTDSPEPALQEQVASGLVSKGVTLGQLGRSEEEIAAYDELLRRFTDSPEPALREEVATALVFKGLTFTQLGRKGESRVAFAEVIDRFGVAPEPEIQALVDQARSYLNELNEESAPGQ